MVAPEGVHQQAAECVSDALVQPFLRRLTGLSVEPEGPDVRQEKALSSRLRVVGSRTHLRLDIGAAARRKDPSNEGTGSRLLS